MISGDGRHDYRSEITPDPTLCEPCGGRPRVLRKGYRPPSQVSTGGGPWRTIPGEWEDVDEPGTAGVPLDELP